MLTGDPAQAFARPLANPVANIHNLIIIISSSSSSSSSSSNSIIVMMMIILIIIVLWWYNVISHNTHNPSRDLWHDLWGQTWSTSLAPWGRRLVFCVVTFSISLSLSLSLSIHIYIYIYTHIHAHTYNNDIRQRLVNYIGSYAAHRGPSQHDIYIYIYV